MTELDEARRRLAEEEEINAGIRSMLNEITELRRAVAEKTATVYVAMICDRHTDPEPYVFTTAQAAIDYARVEAEANAHRPEYVEESAVDGWLYHATYSVEGDSVWVLEKTVDQP